MTPLGKVSLKTWRTLSVKTVKYEYFSLSELGESSRLPVSLRALLGNILHFEDGTTYKVHAASPSRRQCQ
jgi:aconitate hydratase